MAEAGFPGQHTTTTTVTTNTTVQTNARFDPSYLRTPPGILKAVQFVLNALGSICILCSDYSGQPRGGYFNVVALIGFWLTGILLALYLFHLVEKFYKIPWLKAELVYCAVWSFLYLIAASVVVANHDDAFTAAGFFGFCATVAYGLDAFLKFRAVRSGEMAQGERVVSRQTTSAVSSPHY